MSSEDIIKCLKTEEVFGRALKKIRAEMGLSQAALARICGCDVSSASKLERGRTQPSLHFMLLLSKGLDVAPEDLLAETLKNNPDVPMAGGK